MSATGLAEYGRQFAGFYDRIFPPGPGAEQTAAWLAAHHPGGGALELGVGTGRIALPLAARTGPVTGVDLSPEMLARLRAEVARHGLPVTPVQADIRGYDDGRRYGLVYCVCGTLSMLLDPADQQAVLDACARALAPGGAVVIETHNPAAVEALHGGGREAAFVVPYPGRGARLRTRSVLDVGARRWELSHTWCEGARAREAAETSRLTWPGDIDRYAERAGLRPLARCGDWRGAPFAGSEPTVVCLYGERPRSEEDLPAAGRPGDSPKRGNP
jgi:SAM-dependent methyltransferase